MAFFGGSAPLLSGFYRGAINVTPPTIPPVFDAVSSKTQNADSPLTLAHTCGSGANRILLVGISTDPTDLTGAITVSYNSVAMTAVPSGSVSAGINKTQLFYLLAPSSGTHNIVALWNSGSSFLVFGGISFTGVSQTAPLGTAATSSGTGTTASVNVTSLATSIVVDCLTFDRTGTTTATAAAGQTERWNLAVTGDKRGAASTKTGALSTSMSWTLSASRAWVIAGVGVNGTT